MQGERDSWQCKWMARAVAGFAGAGDPERREIEIGRQREVVVVEEEAVEAVRGPYPHRDLIERAKPKTQPPRDPDLPDAGGKTRLRERKISLMALE